MVDSSEEYTLMEEREELMVSSLVVDDDDEEVKPIFRVAHFLKPTIPSVQKLQFLPSRPKIQELMMMMTSSCFSSLKVQFRGGVMHMKGWARWVDKLKPLYQDTWKKAGIFEAITASTFKIYLHNDLIIALAERWCFQTNTFILPWGEATVTLEDLVVLGGFSVLGHCVLNPLKTKECVEMVRNLREVYKVIRMRKMNVYHHAWMEYFEGKGGDHLEHVAFLTLWLSRYVLPPKSYQNVQQALIPIAFHLSLGNSIALAPAVLASIYRDLDLLKQFIVSSAKNLEPSNSRCNEDELDLILRTPLHFVQLWAWERFPNLQPKPSVVINSGEPRVARWHKVKKLNGLDPRIEIDSAAECFLWRPYAIDTVKNWDINKFYKEREEHVVVGPNIGREILIFARLIRASELVGMDCVELYNPHRVSMQFGFDQDVPGCVNHAWRNYDRPIKDANLYIPSRLFESDVTRRYLEWWKNQNAAPEKAVKRVTKRQRSRTHGKIPKTSWGHKEKLYASVSYEFVQKRDEFSTVDNIENCEMRVVESSDDDNLTISEFTCRRRLIKEGITVPGNQELLPSTHCQSSSALNDGTATKTESLMESNPLSKKLETSNGKSDELDGDEAYVVKEMLVLESKDTNDKGACKLNLPVSLELASEGPNANRSDSRYAEFSSTDTAKMSMETSKDSVEEAKIATIGIDRTEGDTQMRRIEMIDITKLEMRIKNLENIIAGKVPRLGTR